MEEAFNSTAYRIERVVSMGVLDAAGRCKLANRILDHWPDHVDDVCAAGEDDTPAQFQERCGSLALKLHYGDQDQEATFPTLDVRGVGSMGASPMQKS